VEWVNCIRIPVVVIRASTTTTTAEWSAEVPAKVPVSEVP
jgi:hypothetical protein